MCEFSEVATAAVVRVVHAAKEAVALVDLSTPEQLHTAEAIARQELLILSGRSEESARLDPERHLNRNRHGLAGPDRESDGPSSG